MGLRSYVLAAAFMILALSCQLSAKMIYVNNVDGDDGAGGLTPEAPFASLRRGVLQLHAGDVLHIANTGQPYFESLSLGSRSGAPGTPIVIEGNGAVLSGLRPIPAEKWDKKGNGIWFFQSGVRRGSLRPFLVDGGGERVPQVKAVNAIDSGQSAWTAEGVYFKPEEGKSVEEYEMRGTMLAAGVAISGGSHITVRDLRTEYFANDGFNVHGNCRGLFFERIEARWNGDDGFSVHEDVGAVVYGGWFHHNTYGIQDVNASRSVFNGVLSEDNRAHGVHFTGGYHSLVDSVVRNNGTDQIKVDSGAATHLGFSKSNPMCLTLAFIKNVAVSGGRTGVTVTDGARATLTNLYVTRARTGVHAASGSTVHMQLSCIADCGEAELKVDSAADVELGANAYWPGQLEWHGEPISPDVFGDHIKASGTDFGSVISDPGSVASVRGRLSSPMVLLGDRQRIPGLTHDLLLWCCPPILGAGVAATDSDGTPVHFEYDFEGRNPWCRVYPVPEKSPDGTSVVSEAVLTEDVSHGGKACLKLNVEFPVEKNAWMVKLFSVKTDYLRPVRKWEFWVRTEAEGIQACPRVRDAEGEGFYGETVLLRTGEWQKISWDLVETPPVRINGGSGNKVQDCPPVELVLELTAPLAVTRDGMTVYIDDLAVWLEESRATAE